MGYSAGMRRMKKEYRVGSLNQSKAIAFKKYSIRTFDMIAIISNVSEIYL